MSHCPFDADMASSSAARSSANLGRRKPSAVMARPMRKPIRPSDPAPMEPRFDAARLRAMSVADAYSVGPSSEVTQRASRDAEAHDPIVDGAALISRACSAEQRLSRRPAMAGGSCDARSGSATRNVVCTSRRLHDAVAAIVVTRRVVPRATWRPLTIRRAGLQATASPLAGGQPAQDVGQADDAGVVADDVQLRADVALGEDQLEQRIWQDQGSSASSSTSAHRGLPDVPQLEAGAFFADEARARRGGRRRRSRSRCRCRSPSATRAAPARACGRAARCEPSWLRRTSARAANIGLGPQVKTWSAQP